MYIRRTISVLGAALSVGVCVAITYVSRDAGNSTILFNLGFLAVMLLMIAASYLVGLRKLIQAETALARGVNAVNKASGDGAKLSESEAFPLFQNPFLDNCYQLYCRMVKRNPNGGCDIQNYINEDAIDTYVHRGILETIPDILTSLGILGTFVGLVMGLREFDPSGYEQMAGSVTPLINGIKVAFITSIYGIALSLSFSFNLRSEFSNLSAKLDEFLDAYYLNVRPPYEVSSLSQLLEHQKDQESIVNDLTGIFVEQMGKSFEQAIIPAFGRMTDGFQQVTDAFTASQEELLTNVCQAVTRQMRTELMSDFKQITRTVEELTKSQSSYTEFMDRTIGRMQQTLTSLQDTVTQTLASLQDTTSQTKAYLSDSISSLSAAQKDAQQINQEQKDAYQDYIRFMYQSIEKFSDIWEKNSEELRGYSDQIAKMGPVQSNLEMRNQLTRLSNQMQEVLKRLQAADSSTTDGSQSESEETLELLHQTIQKLNELSEQVSRPRLFGRRK